MKIIDQAINEFMEKFPIPPLENFTIKKRSEIRDFICQTLTDFTQLVEKEVEDLKKNEDDFLSIPTKLTSAKSQASKALEYYGYNQALNDVLDLLKSTK